MGLANLIADKSEINEIENLAIGCKNDRLCAVDGLELGLNIGRDKTSDTDKELGDRYRTCEGLGGGRYVATSI